MAKEKKQTNEPSTGGPQGLLRGFARWKLLVLFVVAVGFVVGCVALWQVVGTDILGQNADRYQVAIDDIEVTPQPPWIDSDVKAEVFRDASWDQQQLSLLDHELTIKVAQAFELHTWVAKVQRVSKRHPARVVVQLEYRRPVAMVEVNYQSQPGLLPVDAEGVLLPPGDFSVNQAAQFPRIVVDYSGPAGPVGTQWGDNRVRGGAQIAADLLTHWHDFGLYRIVAIAGQRRMGKDDVVFEIHTRGGSKILWGHPPGEEIPGEADVAQKAKRLQEFVLENGSLEQTAPPITVDLRDARHLTTQPRAAQLRAVAPDTPQRQ